MLSLLRLNFNEFEYYYYCCCCCYCFYNLVIFKTVANIT
jgi:hypothetical protein